MQGGKSARTNLIPSPRRLKACMWQSALARHHMDITLQLRWFAHMASKNSFSYKTRGLYQYLLELSIVTGNEKVFITQEQLASTLAASKSVVNSSLQELIRTNIISSGRGFYRHIAPPSTWIARYQNQYYDTENDTENDTAKNLRLISRGQNGGASENNPSLKGRVFRRDTTPTPTQGTSDIAQKPLNSTCADKSNPIAAQIESVPALAKLPKRIKDLLVEKYSVTIRAMIRDGDISTENLRMLVDMVKISIANAAQIESDNRRIAELSKRNDHLKL